MTELVIAGAYAVLSAGIGFLLARGAGVDGALAALTASVLFLALNQLRFSLLRMRDGQGFEKDLEKLRQSSLATRRRLEDSLRTVAELGDAVARRSERQEKKLVGELRLIEALLRDHVAVMAERSLVSERAGVPRGVPMALALPEDALSEGPQFLDLIRESLEENRVDLYLQPTVSLPQRKMRFYEALTRLRSTDGTVIMPDRFIRAAGPAGLMSVVDNLLLFRCVQVVRHFSHKHRDTAVFCNISGNTLKDADFFPQFLDFLHQHKDLSSRIVFEMAQETILAENPAAEANMRYLAEMGFRLSMDQVTALNLDFAKLKRLGLRFVKVRASMLVSGMQQAKSLVAAEDLKDLLARNGMTLIAERVEDEKAAVQLLDFNVELGQGYLFGEPKPIREIAEIVETRKPSPPVKPPLSRLAKQASA